jgi:hypothetical protein
MQPLLQLFNKFADTCTPTSDIFGFPTWYKYLDGNKLPNPNGGAEVCVPVINGLTDIWLIVAAVTDMLLRVAVLVAIVFVIVGGIRYITSQGTPDKTAKAMQTILQAIIGLAIAITATTLLTFVVGRL